MVQVKRVEGRLVRTTAQPKTLQQRVQEKRQQLIESQRAKRPTQVQRPIEQDSRQRELDILNREIRRFTDLRNSQLKIKKSKRTEDVGALNDLIRSLNRSAQIIKGERGVSRKATVQTAEQAFKVAEFKLKKIEAVKKTKPVKRQVEQTRLKIEGKTILGFRDKATGKFIPRDESNKKKFISVSAKYNTTNLSSLREVEKLQTNARIIDTQINRVSKGLKPNAKELLKSGLNPNQVTAIVLQFEQGRGVQALENLKTDKFFKALESKTRFVDSTSQVQAFKIAVNQELAKGGVDFTTGERFNKLNFNEPVSKFKSELDRLNKFKDKVNKILTQDVQKKVSEKIRANILSAEEKARTGQTLTPKELRSLNELASVRGKKINKQQLDLVKSILIVPSNYGRNLSVRQQQGEKSPLFNDIVSFSKGLKAGAIDPIVTLIGAVWSGSKFTVKSAFNYGVNITKEAQKGNFVIDDDIIKVSRRIAGTAKTAGQLAKNVAKFVKDNPKAAAIIAGASVISGFNFVDRQGRKITKLGYSEYKKSPSFFIGQVVGAIAGIEKILKVARGGARVLSGLSPSFVKVTKEGIALQKELKVFSSVKAFLKDGKRGLFKAFDKNPDIILKLQTVATGAQPLSKQAQIAGQEVLAVNAAADRLTSWIKRKQIVRKPIPGESDFPVKIKNILKRFDEGGMSRQGISRREFALINKWLQKNVAPNITLLERSFYADPAGGLRLSRLAITKQKTASIKDILKGNFKLWQKQGRPQVLIFENASVAKFPKNLKDVEKKLRAGKRLTEKETNRLIAWQVKSGSGKFKPIGSTIYQGGKELEVTLAPGELIKRIKRIGFTFIDGKKVDFVLAEVFKPSKELLKRIKKGQDGKLTDKQLASLEKELRKKLGRKVKVETPSIRRRAIRVADDVPVLRINGNFLRVARLGSKIRKLVARKPITRKPAVRKPVARKPTTRKPITRKPAVRKPTVTKRAPPKREPPRTTAPRKPRTGAPRITTRAPKRAPPRAPPTRTTIRASPILPSPDFDSSAYRDKVIIYEGIFRQRRDTKKPTSKRNPIVTKTVKFKTTRNRAIKAAADKVDRNLARSISLRVIGVTDKRLKDIKPPRVLKKFNKKKSLNTPVLRLVEQPKFAFDKRGEVREAKKSRRVTTKTSKSKTKSIKKRKTRK